MIIKDAMFKNKYILRGDSNNDDFQDILRSYPKINCVICNAETAKRFTRRFAFLFGSGPVTINNNIPDGVFWINGVY